MKCLASDPSFWFYQSINQSIYLHQTTWIHITIKENTKYEEMIEKKEENIKKFYTFE